MIHRLSASGGRYWDIVISAFGEYLGIELRHWTFAVPFCRLLFLVLPGAVVLLSQLHPKSFISTHRHVIIDALHVLGFLSLADQSFSIWDLLGAALVMVSFDMFQRALDRDASNADESDPRPQASSPAETVLTRTRSVHSVLAKSNTQASPKLIKDDQTSANTDPGGSDSRPNTADSKEGDVVRLQRAVAELKTANKAKEILLRSTREELRNARETLNTTFAEYCSLRDELKTIRQSLARDHQAVVYRKDIELFALRKANEQKEKYIMEHDAKFEDVFKQQKATVELKDAQLKMLKERLAFLDRQAGPKSASDRDENMDGDHALEVRLLKIKKGKAARQSGDLDATDSQTLDADEVKDATIATLREQLALAKKAAAEVVNQQGELQRAWDIAKKMQAALRQERELHTQTKEQLQEITVRLEEGQKQARADNSGRLPTIEEDKHELEAMFDAAQEDNLRLYAEVESLEKRLREANARMFTAEQASEALQQQIELEKAINSDLEAARPSVVHRVHFQKMEGQLKEVRQGALSAACTFPYFLCLDADYTHPDQSRDALASKNVEIDLLKKTIAGKNDYVADLKAEVDAAVSFHTQDQEEIERLKQVVAELQATKEQLMRDHERLASQRARQRMTTADRASVRSSGVTLIQELSPSLTRPSDDTSPIEALPPMPVHVASEPRTDSMQKTPKRHMRSRSTPDRLNLTSNDAPASESRGSKRRSLGLKDMMKRIVKKDTKPDAANTSTPVNTGIQPENVRGKTPLSTKDKNTILRPSTAGPTTKSLEQQAVHSPRSVEVLDAVRPQVERSHTPRYYAADAAKENGPERPSTAAANMKADQDGNRQPTSRNWGVP